MKQPVEDRPGFQLKRAHSAFRTGSDQALRHTGVSMAGYAVLRALSDEPDIPAAALARRCFVTRQTLGGVVAGLTADDLVEQREPTRGRSRPLRLTTPGRRVLRDAETGVGEVENRALADFSADDRHRLTELLRRLADTLEAAGVPPGR